MAEVVQYAEDAGSALPTVPILEMDLNPSFTFPPVEPSASHRRMKSMSSALSRPVENHHRRGASALPSFTFNASDTSGLGEENSGEQGEADADVAQPTTPSRGAHKRNTSEFVGGLGLSGAVSSSPTRSSALPLPRRQHRYGHSRSQLTLSSHDLSSIMSPPDSQRRLSTSLPNSPLEYPAADMPTATSMTTHEPFGLSSHELSARPPSRPRVEFSDDVEYIPRPLSTISSETGSSMSTMRGHSLNNSISSVLSLSTPSPPSARVRATSLETTPEDEPRSGPKLSIEASRRVEREGQWLRTGIVGNGLDRPKSEPTAQPSRGTVASEHTVVQPLAISHKKQRSMSDNVGLDRRRSEPAVATYISESSRLSALSLHDQLAVAPYSFEDRPTEARRRLSSRRLRDWAASKLSRKSKERVRPASAYIPITVPIMPQTATRDLPVAETDLDTVFGLDATNSPVNTARAPPVFDVHAPFFSVHTNSQLDDYDDNGTMLDLNAALDPFQIPQSGAQRSRRELHSSRGTKDFVGPGGHYLPTASHRRTESAPMLTAFDHGRLGTPSQSAMADVFEEDEEAAEDEISTTQRPTSSCSTQDDEAAIGVEIVDSDVSASSSTPSLALDDSLQRQRAEAERIPTSYSHLNSRLATPIMEKRSSVIEDTIEEESSPTEPTIVEFHEEPRTQSLTKSSDSSDTPTILATQPDLLTHSDDQDQSITPDSFQSSTFPSPDMARRQSSFDTSRVGTSASSIADTRTMSSCTTGEAPHQDIRISVDDVPSLTSSRSTMVSTMQPNTSRRDVMGIRTPSAGTLDAEAILQRRRKRDSIQSLSQLVGGTFGPRSTGSEPVRPRTAMDAETLGTRPQKKEHRLKKLMFWKSKHRQASASTIL